MKENRGTPISRAAAQAFTPVAARVRAFLPAHVRLAGVAQRLVDRFPMLHDVFVQLVSPDPREEYERWIAAYDTIDDADLAAIRSELAARDDAPVLSLLVPLAGATKTMLDRFVESVYTQVYEGWELMFISGPAVDKGAARMVGELTLRDRRCKPVAEAQSPADSWNAALRSATGEFLVLVDPRASLRRHALFLLQRTIAQHPDALLVYCDEDVIDENGSRSAHYFKPDWNEALFRAQNYLGDLVCFRRSHALAVGGADEELDGDIAWGLFLRMTRHASLGAIQHIPLILLHRRGEPPGVEQDDPDYRERVARAHERRLARLGERVAVEPVGEASYRGRYVLPETPPTVSIIVPTTCNLEVLRPCLEGVLSRTSYAEFEVVVVANVIGKRITERLTYLEAIATRPQFRVLFYEDEVFNFSRMNNWAVERAHGELICFLNDDTEVIRSEWLSAMVAQVLADRVAAVGAMLFYPNDRIQHAGMVVGAGHVAALSYERRPRGVHGYHDRALVDQDVSCVAAACMLVRRDVFRAVGCFDEALAVGHNDVDLCLRLRAAGWRVIWTPSAELYHRGSASIGLHYGHRRQDEWRRAGDLMRSRWNVDAIRDPHHNPNLSLDPLRLWEPAFPPRVSYPWRNGWGLSGRADEAKPLISSRARQ